MECRLAHNWMQHGGHYGHSRWETTSAQLRVITILLQLLGYSGHLPFMERSGNDTFKWQRTGFHIIPVDARMISGNIFTRPGDCSGG